MEGRTDWGGILLMAVGLGIIGGIITAIVEAVRIVGRWIQSMIDGFWNLLNTIVDGIVSILIVVAVVGGGVGALGLILFAAHKLYLMHLGAKLELQRQFYESLPEERNES